MTGSRTITLTRGEIAILMAAILHVEDEDMRTRTLNEMDMLWRARECGDPYELLQSAAKKIFEAPIEPPVGTFEPWQFRSGGWGLL